MKGHILSTSGVLFKPATATRTQISVDDIATALARIARYGGHGRKRLSVAEHSVKLADYGFYQSPHRGNKKIAYNLLGHDMHEGVIGVDMPGPYKEEIIGWNSFEDTVAFNVACRFGFDKYAMSIVYGYDKRIVTDERQQLWLDMPDEIIDSSQTPLGVGFEFWDEDRAKLEFITRFIALAPEDVLKAEGY